ncbi:MAG: ABC transporter permease [bacterium]
MLNDLRKLWKYRELLISLTLREVKVRYKQVYLGFGWAVLQPLVLMVVFTVVFTKFAHIATGDIPYPLFAYSALLPWSFFAASISFAIPSLISNTNLVTKTYFPREIIPFATIAASLVDFLIASTIFVLMMVVYQLPLSRLFLLIPGVMLVQILFAAGLSLAGAAINVFYRDVRYIVPIGLQVWMFLSPVIYPLTAVPDHLRWVYSLNPMVGIIESFRTILLYRQLPDVKILAPAVVVSVLLFACAYCFFKKQEMKFADVI